jgi:hypothetical protein
MSGRYVGCLAFDNPYGDSQMDPTAALLLLSLTAPLDSSSFAVREKARKQLNGMEPAACAMAMPALIYHRSVEVSDSANRFVSRWDRMWLDREMAGIGGQLDRLLFSAVHAPIEDKPWRELDKFEKSVYYSANSDKEVWKKWAIETWRKKAKPMLDRKYKGTGNYFDDGQGVLSVLCYDTELEVGHLVGTIWQVRMIEARGGKKDYWPTADDW